MDAQERQLRSQDAADDRTASAGGLLKIRGNSAVTFNHGASTKTFNTRTLFFFSVADPLHATTCLAYSTFRLHLFITVFSLTLARSPMASRSYQWASDFLNYSPRLASNIQWSRKVKRKILLIFCLSNGIQYEIDPLYMT